MFVRKKKNKSGIISVQIIDKSSGKYKVFKTIGSSADSRTIEELYVKAKLVIKNLNGQEQINFEIDKERQLVETFYKSIEDFKLLGPELLLGKIFDEVGFTIIKDELFRHLVISRIVYPVSKLKTIDYLYN